MGAPGNPDPAGFPQVRRLFEVMWTGPEAGVLDLGGQPLLDHLYPAAIESEEFRRLLSLGEQLTIVDLGAGRGSRLVSFLALARPRIVAVDCFPSFGRQPLRYPGYKVLGDIFDLGLRPGVADLAVSAWVTVRNPQFAKAAGRRAYLREIVRLLKPGGIFWGEEPELAADNFAGLPGIAEYCHIRDCHVHSFQKS